MTYYRAALAAAQDEIRTLREQIDAQGETLAAAHLEAQEAINAAQDEIERLISEKEALREQLDGDDEGDIREMLAEIDRLAEPGATCPASDDKGIAGALLAVLRLHKRLNAGICVECSVWDAHVEWPCVTVTTLTEALGGGAS